MMCIYFQALLPFLVASTLAAAAQHNNRHNAGLFDIQAARKAWTELNPYGNPDKYPIEERQEIRELQKQWERFFEFLPWLQGPPGTN